MADRETHIDIIFRNGLREFEVLPPSDVWDNIQPAIIKGRANVNIRNLAAIAAILISLSVFSFWLTSVISKNFNGPSISMNQDIMPSGSYVNISHPAIKSINPILVRNHEATDPAMVPERQADNQIYFKIASADLFPGALNISGLQRQGKPLTEKITLTGKDRKGEMESVNLIYDNNFPEKTTNTINHWTVNALASPTYFSSKGFGKNNASSNLANNEKSATSYSGGVSFSYAVNKRISFTSGVYYSMLGQTVNGINSFSGLRNYYNAKGEGGFSIQTSNGMIVSTNSDIYVKDDISARVMSQYASSIDPAKADLTYLNSSIIQNFNYLEVPFDFKYKAIDRKLDVNLIGGISYNMLVGNSAFTYVSGVKYSIGKTDGLSPVNFSSSLGLGFEYNFSSNLSLNLEPTLRYYITPIGGQVNSLNHPYSFGVFSGLSYKF